MLYSYIYDIHGIIKIIEFTYSKIGNIEYSYFLKEKNNQTIQSLKKNKYDIIVINKKGMIKKDNKSYTLDHKLDISFNEICSVEKFNFGANTSVCIAGFSDLINTTTIKLSYPKIPFLSEIYYSFIEGLFIRPIIALKAPFKNTLVLHAGTVSKKMKSVALLGRGGVFKTTLVLKAINNGFEYQSDDRVLIKDGKTYAYPTFPCVFNYIFKNKNDEFISNIDRIKILLKCKRDNKKVDFKIANESKLTSIIFLDKRSRDGNISIKRLSIKEIKELIKISYLLDLYETSSVLLKRNPFKSYLYSYSYIYPEFYAEKKLLLKIDSIIDSFISENINLYKISIPTKLNEEKITALIDFIEENV